MIDVTEHFGLVGSVARKFVKKGLAYDDLFQEGCLALVRAVGRFDESRGKFSTFANTVAYNAMSNMLKAHRRREGRTVNTSSILQPDETEADLFLDYRGIPIGDLYGVLDREISERLTFEEACVMRVVLEGGTEEKAAQMIGKSRRWANELKRRSMEKLSKSPTLREYYEQVRT